MQKWSIVLLSALVLVRPAVGGGLSEYFRSKCPGLFQWFTGRQIQPTRRFTLADVEGELNNNHASLVDPHTTGRIKIEGGEARAIAFRINDSEIVRRQRQERQKLLNLDIFIPVKSKEEGSRLYGVLYQLAGQHAQVRDHFPPFLATVRKIGDESDNPLNRKLPADIPATFGMKDGLILRISMERASVISARNFLQALADEGELELLSQEKPR
jgi:hypothetical protein